MLIKYKVRLDAICTDMCETRCQYRHACSDAELQAHCDECQMFMGLYELIEAVYYDASQQGRKMALLEAQRKEAN